MRLIAYYRVSTQKQGDSGLGLDAQKATVQAHAAARGDEIVQEYVEVASGRRADRELLRAALDSLADGHADGLIVAKLDRLARSSVQIGRIMETAQKQRWSLIALDLGIDTSTAAGELVANVMASIAQWEARTIGERTKVALDAARDRGTILGRPVSVDAETAARIQERRHQGVTLAEIAAELNADGVPTSRGGERWWPSTVGKVITRGYAASS